MDNYMDNYMLYNTKPYFYTTSNNFCTSILKICIIFARIF